MDDADLDAEIERLERSEAEEELRWVDDDGRYVAATAGDVAAARAALVAACPELDVRVVRVERSLSELETLLERVIVRAEALGAGFSAGGVLEQENRVEVMLEDLDAPAARTLRLEFEGDPVEWTEGEVVLA